MNFLSLLIIGFAVVFALVGSVIAFTFLPIWFSANSAEVPLSFRQLIGMSLRGLNPGQIIDQLVRLHKTGIKIPVERLETHVLAGGSVSSVADALIAVNKAGFDYSFERIAALDLAGRNVVEAMNSVIEPKVLVCPDKNSGPIMGVAKDGVRLSAKVRITVRSNFDYLIGGAGERTIIARVGEGIVGAIGAASSHREILARPELISKYILDRGLDRGTAYEIVSVDVSDAEVVDNIGARLQEVQATVDKQIAQAKAEMRRVAAVAREREMRAKVVEMTSQLTFARSTVPRALSRAAYKGQISRARGPVGPAPGRILWLKLVE